MNSSYCSFWSAVAGLQGQSARVLRTRGRGLVNRKSMTKRCNNYSLLAIAVLISDTGTTHSAYCHLNTSSVQ